MKPSATLHRLLLPTAIGPLLAEHDGTAVRGIHFFPQGDHPPAGTRVQPTRSDVLGWQIAEEVREYFARERREFTLPLAEQGTPFQQRVWAALRQIPYGATRTYGEIAAAAGTPGGAIAVGQANARNPVPLVVPCHRVLGAGNRLGGFMGSSAAGPGVELKRWLLRHEGVAGW